METDQEIESEIRMTDTIIYVSFVVNMKSPMDIRLKLNKSYLSDYYGNIDSTITSNAIYHRPTISVPSFLYSIRLINRNITLIKSNSTNNNSDPYNKNGKDTISPGALLGQISTAVVTASVTSSSGIFILIKLS